MFLVQESARGERQETLGRGICWVWSVIRGSRGNRDCGPESHVILPSFMTKLGDKKGGEEIENWGEYT